MAQNAVSSAAGAVCAPLQAVQSLVQLYNAISDAREAMTFHERRGGRLDDRIKFVAHRLRQIAEALQFDFQAGRLTKEDAYLFSNRVASFRAVVQDALEVIAKCRGSMFYRFAYATPLRNKILDIDVQINNHINDIRLAHLSFPPSPSIGPTGTSSGRTTGTSGPSILELSSSDLSDVPRTPGEGSSNGLSEREIAELRGYAANQLLLLGLFTRPEIEAFGNYVQDVVTGLGPGYLQHKMATDLPFETIQGIGPVFRPATLPPVLDPRHQSPVSALAVRIDNGTVFSGHRNGVVCLWVNGACAAIFGARASVPVSALLVTADGTLVVASTRGALLARATDPPYDELPGPTYEQPGKVTALAVSDGGVLFSGDSEGGIMVWAQGFANPGPYLRAHTKAVTALCVTPRNDSTPGCFLYSGGSDGKIRAWALSLQECTPLPWEEHFNVQLGSLPVRALALSAEGGALYSVRNNGHVARWAVPGADKKCALALAELKSGPVAITERGLVLGTTYRDHHVAAWHVGQLTPDNVQFLRRSSDPKRPVVCGGPGLPLDNRVYGRAQGTLGPLDEITAMKVVEVGTPGCQALLVTGHRDGGVRICHVASW